MKTARAWIAVVAALGTTVLACQALLGIEDVEGKDPVVTADAADPIDAGPTCRFEEALFAPPPVNGGSPAEARIYTFLLRAIHWLPEQRDGVLGKDLDGLCTGASEYANSGASCVDGPPDERGGVDNAFGAVVRRLAEGLAPGEDADPFARRMNKDLEGGQASVFVVLYGWNGAPDDSDVNVALLPSFGLQEHFDPPADPFAKPKWDGNDVWSFAESGPEVTPDDAGSRVINTYAGYVNNSVLVVRGSANQVVSFPFLGTTLELLGGGMTATLVRPTPEGPWTLQEGTAAGTLDPVVLHSIVRTIKTTESIGDNSSGDAGADAGDAGAGADAGDGVGLLCDNKLIDCLLYKDLNAAVDMPQPGQDSASNCARVSIGFGFNALEGKRASTPTPRAPERGCKRPTFDPAFCSTP